MKSLLLKENFHLHFIDRNIIDPKDNEVLIRVKSASIWGSDLKSYSGHHPVVKPPIVLWHEVAGGVYAVGKKVTKLKKVIMLLLILQYHVENAMHVEFKNQTVAQI